MVVECSLHSATCGKLQPMPATQDAKISLIYFCLLFHSPCCCRTSIVAYPFSAGMELGVSCLLCSLGALNGSHGSHVEASGEQASEGIRRATSRCDVRLWQPCGGRPMLLYTGWKRRMVFYSRQSGINKVREELEPLSCSLGVISGD